jgi:hypothetical protein
MEVWKLLLVLTISSIGFPIAEAKTYEEFFTEKAGQAYNEDINVWAYTSEFSRRFAMPEEWIDDKLKGAYAVAFRVETASGRIRFPHKGPNVSMLTRRCILDVYVDEETPIPWANDQIADFRFYTPSSPTYLLPQTEGDIQWRDRPIGISISGDLAKEPLIYMGREGNTLGGSLYIREYDKKMYPGVTYISLDRTCMTPPKQRAWIEFMHDGDWHYGKHESRDIAHRIDIPESFMVRLYDLWFERNRKPAVENWKKVIR